MINGKLFKEALELYAGHHVMERVLTLKKDAFIREAEVFNGTIYSQNISSFSSITESLNMNTMLQLITTYLDNSIEALNNSNGIVDQIIGDLIISYWREDKCNNHPDLACDSALTSLNNNIETCKIKSINIFIGIHSAKFIIGNLGSKYRLVNTIMGDSLNLTERLSNANKYYGTNIIISESVKNALSDKFITRELDIINIVGKDDAIKIYELYGYKSEIDSQQIEMLKLFEDAISEFRNCNWAGSQKLFKKIIQINSNDGPANAYLQRCIEFKKNPPSKKWKGAYTVK